MNTPNHPRSAVAGPRLPEGASARESLNYSWRTDLCPDCDSATGSRGCETCEGSGEVTAACVGCFNCYPLNDDGECRDCADEPAGWQLAEEAALKRRAA